MQGLASGESVAKRCDCIRDSVTRDVSTGRKILGKVNPILDFLGNQCKGSRK